MFSRLRNWFPWGGGGFASLLPRVFPPSCSPNWPRTKLPQYTLLWVSGGDSLPWKGTYWQYWGRLDAQFSAATKAVSVKMDVELFGKGRKIRGVPSPSITCGWKVSELRSWTWAPGDGWWRCLGQENREICRVFLCDGSGMAESAQRFGSRSL